jgi:hypothetical protein
MKKITNTIGLAIAGLFLSASVALACQVPQCIIDNNCDTNTTVNVTVTPEISPEISPEVSPEVTPSIEVTPEPTATPAATTTTTGTGGGDGRSDGLSSCPDCTKAHNAVVPAGPPATGKGN